MNNKIIILSVVTIVGIMMLSLLATKPLANQAFAKCATDLTLSLNPDRNKGGAGESAVTTVSGKLTCNGTGIGGADIKIHSPCISAAKCVPIKTVKTDSSGSYSESSLVSFTACKMPFEVEFEGDSAHSGAAADATYHVDKLDEPCPSS